MRRRAAAAAVTAAAALAAVLLFPGPAALAQDGRDPGELLEDGRRAFERGEYERAREDLWAYLDATANLTGAAQLPQAEALYTIALMEPDAAVAERHYRIIAEEFAAASIADQAIFRLAMYDFVQGRTEQALQWLEEVEQNYPYSHLQAELPLWIGRARLEAGDPSAATERFIEGLTRVKSADLPVDLPSYQREALAAEYAWWLATAYRQAGDTRTAGQYLTLLTLDYPNSPQAAEARDFQATTGAAAPVAGEVAVAAPVAGGEPAAGEEPSVLPQPEDPAPTLDDEEPAPEPLPDDEPVAVQPIRPEPTAEDPVDEPAEELPVADPPADEAVAETPPAETPPAETPPAETPPAETPPAETPPAETPPIETPPPGPTPIEGTVYLQIGAFASAANAADLSKRLKADGFEPAVEVGIVDGRGFYRVRIGPFRTPEAAQRLAAVHSALISLGYPAQQIATD